jgi:hypothetical protein
VADILFKDCIFMPETWHLQNRSEEMGLPKLAHVRARCACFWVGIIGAKFRESPPNALKAGLFLWGSE